MALNLIMLGPPGAGKGTQAEGFAREHRIPRISTGDMLREAAHAGTPIGLAAREKMDAGLLVSDDVIIALVRERLERPDTVPGFVLDGFPRTVAQAEALDRIMRERGGEPLVVVDVEVPQEELVSRLAMRRICVKCGTNADPKRQVNTCPKCGGELVQRTDDNKDVVLERLHVYHRSTTPVLEYYRERPTFRVVNGAQPADRVAHELDTLIDDAAGAKAL